VNDFNLEDEVRSRKRKMEDTQDGYNQIQDSQQSSE